MKKLIIIAVVLVMVLGLLLTTGASAADPPAQPVPFRSGDAVLLTIAEDVVIEPGVSSMGDYIDVKSYRQFKVYASLRPRASGDPQPLSHVSIFESATGMSGSVNVEFDNVWEPRSSRWMLVSDFDGLYSKLKVSIKNRDSAPITVSIYLLMAE
ncbi:hypothetical protein ACFLUP_04415, partial [Chloroflexota bacterium]